MMNHGIRAPQARVPTRRSCGPGGPEPSASPRTLVDLPGDPGHDPAVAPTPGHAQMDPSFPTRRPSAARRARGGADPAAGPGEPSLGLPAHSGRTEEARDPR